MNELYIVGTSIDSEIKSRELGHLLANESDDLSVYAFRPTPGVIMGAAFDWTAILGMTADVLGVAGGVWAVYERFIKKQPTGDKAPKLLLQVKAESGSFVQIVINSDSTQERFAEEFSEAVIRLRASEDPDHSSSMKDLLDASPNHRRIPRDSEP